MSAQQRAHFSARQPSRRRHRLPEPEQRSTREDLRNTESVGQVSQDKAVPISSRSQDARPRWEFFAQVKALLIKDLLLKRRRCCSLCCDLMCPILLAVLVVVLIAIYSRPRNVSGLTLYPETLLLDANGTANIVDPFPDSCIFSRPNGNLTRDSVTVLLLLDSISPPLAALFYRFYNYPDASDRKRFAIGPSGDIAAKLKGYFDHRLRVRYAASGDPTALYHNITACDCPTSTATAFEQCLTNCSTLIDAVRSIPGRNDSTACFLESRRLENNISPGETLSHDVRRRLEQKECVELLTGCECASNPTCGWLVFGSADGPIGICRRKDTHGGYFRGGVSCYYCGHTRPECSLHSLWKKIGNKFNMLTPEIVTLDSDALDEKIGGGESFCAGVFFDSANVEDVGEELGYQLQFPYFRPPKTRFSTLLPNINSLFASSQSVYLQRLVDEFITCDTTHCLGSSTYTRGQEARETTLRLSAFPVAPQRKDGTADVIFTLLGAMVPMLLSLLSLIWAFHLLREKEWKVKTAMLAHGVRLSAYYTEISVLMLGWSMLCTLLPSLIMVYIPKFIDDRGVDIGAGTLFLILWLSLWNAYALVTLITVFFKRPFPAIAFLFGILSGTRHLIGLPANATASIYVTKIAALHPLLNVELAFNTARDLDISRNANDFSLAHHFFSLRDSVVMNLMGIMLWHLLFFYFDIVLQEGSSRRWYFPCAPASGRLSANEDGSNSARHLVQPPTPVEIDAKNRGRILDIANVSKAYGAHTAVNSISATMYAGEIFALLGHNGAGKSTSFGMISGTIAMDSGSIHVFGRPLREHLRLYRHKVSICPQENLLWPILSVDQHLRLFSSFKGVTYDARTQQDIDGTLAMLSLLDKKNALVSTLSGGMVRKLCLAISMLGDPDLLLLDEPTSGLDPTARREVWDMLLARKQNRVVVLSTHYMEEADALGDRVAIMNNGRVECNGSPMFLKEKYGCGYNLTCLLADSVDSAHKNSLRSLIARHVASAEEEIQILANVGREVTFLLPFSSSSHFPSLFSELDENSLVESYSIGVSELEEVFLKVASHYEASTHSPMESIARKAGDLSGIGGAPQGKASFATQFRACMSRRLFFARRRPCIDLCTCFLPVIFLLLGILIAKIEVSAFSISTTLSLPYQLSTWDAELFASDAPVPVSVGLETNAEKGEKEGYAKSIFEAAKHEEFRTTSWGPLSPPNSSIVTEAGPPMCRQHTENGQQHIKNVESMASMLVANDTKDGNLRYAAFIFPNANGSTLPITAMVNLHAVEAAGMTLNMYSNLALRANKKSGRIRASAKDMVPPNEEIQRYLTGLVSPFILQGLGIAALIFTSLFFVEKDNGILKHQMSIGLRAAPYWVSNWIYDGFLHLFALLFVYFTIYMTNMQDFMGNEYDQWMFTLLLFLVGALAQPWYCYAIGTLFTNSTTALMALFVGNILVAGVLLRVGATVDQGLSAAALKDDVGNSIIWHWVLVIVLWIARLSPVFAIATGLQDLRYLTGSFWLSSPPPDADHPFFDRCRSDAAANKRYGLECATSVWDVQYGPMRNLLMLLASLALWPLVIVLVTKLRQSLWWRNAFREKRPPLVQNWSQIKDSDVMAEESRVATIAKSSNPTNVLLAQNLRQVFKVAKQKHKYVHAIQGVSFALDVGEVFGLLGINGAGKSSLFRMLAGEELPLRGQTSYHPAASSLRIMRDRGVGYCPQHDPLWAHLSPREHLTFACQVKGIARGIIPRVVTELMRAVDLTPYANVQSARLSGGNKRKLCVAMSLVGTPKILLLDEPSAGVDPLSRRFMWGVIQQIAERDKTTTVVLSTHSMEECEALCTRSAIMVNGVLRCIGPNTRIRNKYSKGVVVDVSFSVESHDEEHEKLLSRWGYDPSTSVVTFADLRSYLDSQRGNDQYSLHARLLDSTNTCFSNVAEIVAKKNILHKDAVTEQNITSVAESACDPRVATLWWRCVERCGVLMAKVRAEMPSTEVEFMEAHGEKFRLRLLDCEKKSSVCSLMEKFKRSEDIVDYSLSKASLESIFNRFAREPLNNRGYKKNPDAP